MNWCSNEFYWIEIEYIIQNCSVYEELSKEDISQELGRSDHSKDPEYDPEEPEDSSFLNAQELGRSDHSQELGRSDHSKEPEYDP